MKTAKIVRRLTGEETKLFGFLLDVTKQRNVSCVLRVAGGWVRDNLLGLNCADVDIAIEGTSQSGGALTGEELGNHIAKYQEETKQEAAHIAVIKANPDQSKHLETATCTIFGIDLDLVNLRKEDYAAGSRIPTMQPATAEEDALRRDLTINSMFYNLHTELIEDWTGKGLEDLKHKIIRTPLPARETFLDDPLRILRAIRFACRYGFDIAEDVSNAVVQDDIRRALVEKVSRERVGIEVGKMLEGRDAVRALELIGSYNLRDVVFQRGVLKVGTKMKPPYNIENFEPLAWKGEHHGEGFESWEFAMKLFRSIPRPTEKQDAIPAALSALLFGQALQGRVGQQITINEGNDISKFIDFITTYGLKQSGTIQQKTYKTIIATNNFLMWLRTLDISKYTQSTGEEQLQQCLNHSLRTHDIDGYRVKVGDIVRATGPQWKTALRYACFIVAPELTELVMDTLQRDHQWLESVETMKPIMQGNTLSTKLQARTGCTIEGKLIGMCCELLLKYQIAYPRETEERNEQVLLDLISPNAKVLADSAGPPAKKKK